MRKLSVLLALVALGVLVPVTSVAPQQATYRILVGDDDGVRAPGIVALAQALRALGEVIVIAPEDNQSGKGHSITISDPIRREDFTLPGGITAIGLTATPVSAVRVGLKKIVTAKPDLVVSGINRGYNLGLSSYLSGTVGVAREAAMQGIPAIASSLAAPATADYSAAAEATLRVARFVKERGLPRGVFLNVNIPTGTAATWKGFLVTTQAMSAGGEEDFDVRTHPATRRPYYWNLFKEGGTGPEGTDMWAVEHGYVSITPFRVGELDQQAFDRLKGAIR
jgi:5'-nucleotidase